MANPEHLEILKRGPEQWNKWREESSYIKAYLRGADLSEADLHGANFSGAYQRGRVVHRHGYSAVEGGLTFAVMEAKYS